MNKSSKIYIAGHNGMVGSAIVKNLNTKGYKNIVTRGFDDLDLRNQQAVSDFFKQEKPELVVLAAAKVGGIVANNIYRAEFIYDNIQIQNNVIHSAYESGVEKLLFLGSTCIYPKECPQPMKEEYLLTGELEYTNEPYAIAKIAGMKMVEAYNLQYQTNYIAVMPTNLYGPNDNFDLEKSHVLPALVRKIHLGKALEDSDWETIRKDLNTLPIEGVNGNASEKEILSKLYKYGLKEEGNKVQVEIWGTGKPMREFLWSEDMADACVYLLENYNFEKEQYGKDPRNFHVNIGTGTDLSIGELAEQIKKEVGFQGELFFNTDKPDGTMKKLTNVSRLHEMGWKHKVDLPEGIRKIYAYYLGR